MNASLGFLTQIKVGPAISVQSIGARIAVARSLEIVSLREKLSAPPDAADSPTRRSMDLSVDPMTFTTSSPSNVMIVSREVGLISPRRGFVCMFAQPI